VLISGACATPAEPVAGTVQLYVRLRVHVYLNPSHACTLKLQTCYAWHFAAAIKTSNNVTVALYWLWLLAALASPPTGLQMACIPCTQHLLFRQCAPYNTVQALPFFSKLNYPCHTDKRPIQPQSCSFCYPMARFSCAQTASLWAPVKIWISF